MGVEVKGMCVWRECSSGCKCSRVRRSCVGMVRKVEVLVGCMV